MKCAEHKGALGKYFSPSWSTKHSIWVSHIDIVKNSTLLGCDAVSLC